MRLASRSSTRRLGIGWAWWVGREGRTVASVREREDMKGEEREHCGIEPAPALKRSRILWSRLLFAKLPDSLSLSPSLFSLSAIHGPSRNNGPTPLSKGDATVRKTQRPIWLDQRLKVPRFPQLRVCSPPPRRQPLLLLGLFSQAYKAGRRR